LLLATWSSNSNISSNEGSSASNGSNQINIRKSRKVITPAFLVWYIPLNLGVNGMRKINFCAEWTYRRADEDRKVSISVPHDAMITEKRHPKNPSGSAGAYFPGGIYIYEKQFVADPSWSDGVVWIEFEGVYKDATVYVNDQKVGFNAYGYVPFKFDITSFLKFGETNTITVNVDNEKQPNSRWYTGSGIYRPVHLYVGKKYHIQHEGLRITTLSINPAVIQVETRHNGDRVEIEIFDGDVLVARGESDSVKLEIQGAKLWSDESPHLYRCVAKLYKDGELVDEAEETFGIRKIEWSVKGLMINGKETLLRGGCVHHDHGLLGAATLDEAEDRRVRILKQAGYNAIRSSHNPASMAMLRACDRYGMYVIDETWDMWYSRKQPHDYANVFMDNYQSDIKAMVSRDYNHPSVIMYSIGNEVSEPHNEKGVELMEKLVECVKALDHTRPVTCGLNLMVINMASKGKGIYKEEGGMSQGEGPKLMKTSSTLFNMMTQMVGTGMNKAANSRKVDLLTKPAIEKLDIAGYNYASGRYPLEAKQNPNRIVVGTETFPQDIYRNWQMVKEYPYLIGDFMWTAWDYLGEAGIGAWTYDAESSGFDKPYPWLLANPGVIDILGNIGAQAVYAAIVWGLRKEPYIGVRPINQNGAKVYKSTWRGTNAIDSWSWRGCEGEKAYVEVYGVGASVELLLNGRSLGRKKLKACKTVFKVRYEPGTLEAVNYDANWQMIQTTRLESADAKLALQIQPESGDINQGDLLYVHINVADHRGVVESNCDDMVKVSVAGGQLLAYGSANPRTEEQYHVGEFTTYYGRSLAIIRVGDAEKLVITASSKKLGKAEKVLEIR
jgi:hypothetical protein